MTGIIRDGCIKTPGNEIFPLMFGKAARTVMGPVKSDNVMVRRRSAKQGFALPKQSTGLHETASPEAKPRFASSQ